MSADTGKARGGGKGKSQMDTSSIERRAQTKIGELAEENSTLRHENRELTEALTLARREVDEQALRILYLEAQIKAQHEVLAHVAAEAQQAGAEAGK